MANIYLNEFDRFMVHQLKPLAYMRYGDDWLCFARDRQQLEQVRGQATLFLGRELSLKINAKIDCLQPVYKGISYLGVDIWPGSRRLQPRVRQQIRQRLNDRNTASYRALISAHEKSKRLKEFDWYLLDQDARVD